MRWLRLRARQLGISVFTVPSGARRRAELVAASFLKSVVQARIYIVAAAEFDSSTAAGAHLGDDRRPRLAPHRMCLQPGNNNTNLDARLRK